MAKDKVRVGIFGGGGILMAHGPGFKNVADQCEVVAVAEPQESQVAWIRGMVGDSPEIYPDYETLLEKADVDAVDILLPHDLHLPATIAAAKAGKHVLVEKVMARNVYECDRMIEACDEAGVSLTVCHDRRYNGEWQALKNVCDSGLFGEVFYLKLEHNNMIFLPEDKWIRNVDKLGGGAIMSCLTHQIDALRFYAGEVASVQCMLKVLPDQMEGEAIGLVTVEMQSGAIANLNINWRTRSRAGDNGLSYELVQICGLEGEGYFRSGKGTFALEHKPSGKTYPQFEYEEEGFDEKVLSKVKTVGPGGHIGCIREWVKMLRGEEATILTDGRDVRGTVEVAEAAYISAAEGRTVKLPIEPQPWAGMKY